jgi:hypothetical protein
VEATGTHLGPLVAIFFTSSHACWAMYSLRKRVPVPDRRPGPVFRVPREVDGEWGEHGAGRRERQTTPRFRTASSSIS